MWSGNWNQVLQISSGHSLAHIESSILIECVQVFLTCRDWCEHRSWSSYSSFVPGYGVVLLSPFIQSSMLYDVHISQFRLEYFWNKVNSIALHQSFMKTWFGDEIFDSDEIKSSPPQSPVQLLSFDTWKILSVFWKKTSHDTSVNKNLFTFCKGLPLWTQLHQFETQTMLLLQKLLHRQPPSWLGTWQSAN